jgi:hypothetical protein
MAFIEIYWGELPDTTVPPARYEFDDENVLEAFLYGVEDGIDNYEADLDDPERTAEFDWDIGQLEASNYGFELADGYMRYEAVSISHPELLN